jgi:hypothetical protein
MKEIVKAGLDFGDMMDDGKVRIDRVKHQDGSEGQRRRI